MLLQVLGSFYKYFFKFKIFFSFFDFRNSLFLSISRFKNSITRTPQIIDLTLSSLYNDDIDERLYKSTPDLSRTSTPIIPSKYYSPSSIDAETKVELYQQRHDNSVSSSDILEFLERRRLMDDSAKAYRNKKHQDEEEGRFAEIRQLEKEARDRSKARLNRQILSEEYCRLRLELEGLILERPTKKDDFPGLFFRNFFF